jgi:hypothetical protein
VAQVGQCPHPPVVPQLESSRAIWTIRLQAQADSRFGRGSNTPGTFEFAPVPAPDGVRSSLAAGGPFRERPWRQELVFRHFKKRISSQVLDTAQGMYTPTASVGDRRSLERLWRQKLRFILTSKGLSLANYLLSTNYHRVSGELRGSLVPELYARVVCRCQRARDLYASDSKTGRASVLSGFDFPPPDIRSGGGVPG